MSVIGPVQSRYREAVKHSDSASHCSFIHNHSMKRLSSPTNLIHRCNHYSRPVFIAVSKEN